jgi:hypothetical protein
MMKLIKYIDSDKPLLMEYTTIKGMPDIGGDVKEFMRDLKIIMEKHNILSISCNCEEDEDDA